MRHRAIGGAAFGSRLKGRAAFVIGLALVVVLSACGAEPEEQERVQPTRTLVPPTETPAVTPAPLTPTPTDLPGPSSFSLPITPMQRPGLPDDLSAALRAAVDELAASGEETRADVRILSLERYRWPDASLGCAGGNVVASAPPEGAEGYRILLAGRREVYAFHTLGDAVARCAPAGLAAGLSGEPLAPDPIAAAIVDLVRRDWAEENGVAEAEVEVIGLLSVNWPDASLGCPKTGDLFTEQETPGYRIVVRAGESEGIYHTNIQGFVRCAPDEEVLSGLLLAALATPTAVPAE